MDPNNLDKPVNSIFRMIAYGHHKNEQEGAEGAGKRQAECNPIEANRRRDRLFDMHADNKLTKEEFLSHKIRLNDEVVLGGARRKSQRDREVVESLLRFCCAAHESFTQREVRAKREVAHAVGSRLSFTLAKAQIELHPPFNKLNVSKWYKRAMVKKGILPSRILYGGPSWTTLELLFV